MLLIADIKGAFIEESLHIFIDVSEGNLHFDRTWIHIVEKSKEGVGHFLRIQ